GSSRRHHPSRPQAGEHHADQVGCEAARLRPGEIEGPGGPKTASGTILGTMHYMSPEQVEGKEADSRSDIWALGVVIYEMVTGTRPFDGESAASIIGSILKDSPPTLSARQPLV